MDKAISIVVPAYNEEHNVGLLYKRLKLVLDSLKCKYEIIFVDDGSQDRTFEVLKQLHKKDKKLRVIRFQRNFQKAAALSAGFEAAKGDIIITLDADLQDDPAEIPRLLKKLDEGYDLVVGWKFKRRDTFSKRIFSKLFNLLVRNLTKVKIHDSDCNFRAMKRNIISNLKIYGGLYRYIPSLAYNKGYRVGEIKVFHHRRRHGKSKYGAGRLIKGFFDLITTVFILSYTKRPLHLFGSIGIIFSVIGFLIGIYLSIIKIFLDVTIGNKASLLLAMLLILTGIQFISIGLIGELMVSQKSKKDYIIKEML